MKKTLLVVPICTLFLSGCLPDNVADEIEKVESENQKSQNATEEEDKKLSPENVLLTKEQLEILKEHENVSSEEAVNELIEEEPSIKISVPKEKDAFDSEQEFAQYLSNLFFLYHTGQVEPELFYERVKPHLHENFLEMLPKEESDRKETFEILQLTFMQYLPAPIVSYELTEPAYLERVEEATFYRKYVTKDHDPIYYQTVIKKEDGHWQLFDDSPAPPYEINPTITSEFKNPGGE